MHHANSVQVWIYVHQWCTSWPKGPEALEWANLGKGSGNHEKLGQKCQFKSLLVEIKEKLKTLTSVSQE